jgi:hypothetical protein
VPVDDIVSPQNASVWWLITGLILIAVVAGWYVFVFVNTRHRPPKPDPNDQPLVDYSKPGDPFAALRMKYLAKVDAVAQEFANKTIDVRELHLRLSTIVREFAQVRRGVDTTVMTLTEIEQLPGVGSLASLISYYYQPSFARQTAMTGLESIDGAREVISRW